VDSGRWTVDERTGEAMRASERKLARKKLDEEMRPFRRAMREKDPTNELLRAVRHALQIPVAEIAHKMGLRRSSGVFDMESNEASGAITMRSLERQAEAMGCKVVYGIVPEGGKTLERLAEERYWKKEAVKRGGVQMEFEFGAGGQ
jgi:predicted DNA-binding mobile mystery protein A